MARLQEIVTATLFLALSLVLLCNRIEASAPEPEIHIAPPIAGLRMADLHDSFDELHFGHRHEAIDIMEPRGTPIRAVDDGTIRKLFLSRAGGITLYQFDRTGSYCYYYAHLDHYAEDLREGMPVARGQIIGYVGTTGDASPDAPQLHFAIFRLDSDKSWWKGTPINPYPILVDALKRVSSSV
jgi:murein DD-endopeptidase MepM/ murein hydrolase activator NlpD